MSLPQADQARITDSLNGAGATLPCPRCGHTDFTLLDGYVIENLQSQIRNVVIGSNNRLVTAVMVCSGCGFMSWHAMHPHGPLPIPQGDSAMSREDGGACN